MLGFIILSNAAVTPLNVDAAFPCAGIAMVEASARERPAAFASLRQVDKVMRQVRNAEGLPVRREISVTNVKPIAGFTNCRFVYSSQIDLACYVGTTLPDSQTDAIGAKLISVAESIGQCLTNPALVRSQAEPGSTPSIHFGGGPRQSFWQISMVPSLEDPSRMQPELLVLGPSQDVAPPRQRRATTKTRRRGR